MDIKSQCLLICKCFMVFSNYFKPDLCFCSNFQRNKQLFEPLALLRLKDFSLPVQNGGHFEKLT